MELSPGTLVTRNVRLVRPLGKGGMGSVWVGEHTTLDTEVAVKFISPEHAQKTRFVARFRREASSAAKIKSPHVVQIFDHGLTEDDVPYIVMELLSGESLSQRLKRDRKLSAREVAMLVAQVAKVLTIAHGLGIVHRDLKPDNIFLVESGYELFVKVLDFGIAKQLDPTLNEITDTGAMVGTPYYMSPEMLISPKDADHRADLWALAVVAYHALTGRLPFRGETLAALSIAINDGTFKPPSALVTELGAELDVWFKLALCRNIDGRCPSAAELARSFRQALMVSGDQSGDKSGDKSADSLEHDLPHTEKPASDTHRSPVIPTVTGAESSDGLAPTALAQPQSTRGSGDATLTSDQLAVARLRDGQPQGDSVEVEFPSADAAAPAATLEAAVPQLTTLEGTSASGTAKRTLWWPWAGAAAALLVAAGVLAFGQDDPVPALSAAPVASSPAPRPEPAPAEPQRVEPQPDAKAQPSSSTPAPASSSSHAKRQPPAPAAPAPPRASTAPVDTKGRPAYCATNKFYVDAEGLYQPRPECFR